MIYEGVLQDYRDYYAAHVDLENRSILDVEYLRSKEFVQAEPGRFIFINRFKSRLLGHQEAV